MHGLRLWAPLVASCLTATSCSMARFGYDMLPTWTHWQVERYLSLDEDQRAIVSRRIDELHRWHRRSQLPQYVAFLQEVEEQVRAQESPRGGAARAAAGVDAARIGRWRDRIGEAWTPLAERLAPGMAELALTLRPEQLERLRKRMDDSNDEYRDKVLKANARDRREARADRVVKRAEFFLGSLESEQERELRKDAGAMPAAEEAWMAERLARQAALLGLFTRLSRERPTQAEATRQTREFLANVWTSPDARRRARLEESIAGSDALSAQMLAQATPNQRAHLLKLVRGYADDFRSLSSTSVAAR